MSKIDKVEVAIIGAGTAGLAALRDVRGETDDFVLINAGAYGTTCARVGCMPSKALIAASDAYHARKKLEEFGIHGGDALRADIPAVLDRIRALRDHFVGGVLKTTRDLGERSIAGHARLDGPNRVIIGDRAIEAERIILAPGSSPIVPKPWREFGERILTSDTIFEQEDLPPRIGVIGLGAIGVELAQALARLGIEIHGFDGAERIAGITDAELAELAREVLSADFPIHLSVQAELAVSAGGIEIRWGDHAIEVDAVIAAVGRRPNLEGLGLETLGVKLDDRGLPEIDPETMRIGTTPVFLAGDANAYRPLLHEAADEGHIAAINAISEQPVRLARRTAMSIVFCDPQIAHVGERGSELDSSEVLTGTASFAAQGRARIMQRNQGLVRLHASRKDGRLLGAEMVAPNAEHMAHLLALAIGERLSVHDLLRMPYYHPTLEEGLRPALRMIARDLPPCAISDLARCAALEAEALD